ncbi:FAD-binding protein [Rubrivivax albus]|uniref:FAD-binding protein n=2 Tax=Rubrivivax albus TaxID=2499835 RepID=A0A437JMV2_9BURK|nr:FAD-binding protein [Rubrivivax albus]
MWDVIVIGSGIGGITAAGLLAGVAGKRVLVLEKHSEPGGLTHAFRRDGASWDVGLHYIGQVAPGSQPRAILDYLSGGALRWNRMPDDFERFVYPGLDFAVPSEAKRFAQRLVERFPDEAAAIHRYFRDVRAAERWAILGFAQRMVPRPVVPLLRAWRRLTGSTATQTTKAYLEAHFRSPQLRALLATQWGDYGLPPSQSAFAIHALIVAHYLDGAWFPEGGAGRIARTFEPGIERHGGAVRVCQEVESILLRDGRAVGVKVVDRRGANPQRVTHLAPVVISNVGVPITFGRLLPTDGEVGAKTDALRALAGRLGNGHSAVTLYVRLKASASTLGVRGENYWINADTDHDALADQGRRLLEGQPSHIYLSFPSLKSGDDRFHTAEIIAVADTEAFDAWRDHPRGNRGADYSALKTRIGDGLLRLAETAVPGLGALVEYAELSTPLTVEHYTSHPGGRFYGLAATPERFRSAPFGPATPIPGLYLSGQDAVSLGIFGAMMGGFGAACQVLGSRGYPMIRAAIAKGPSRAADAQRAGGAMAPAAAGDKRRAVLVSKQRLTPTIWRLAFELDRPVDGFAPGQFARLEVAGYEWRDYSIAGLDGNTVHFLISTRTGGLGSQFVAGAEPGTATRIELPLGHYTLARSPRRKVFVATGTGLAPFLPMFRQLQQDGGLDACELVFGCRTAAEDITAGLTPLPATVVACVSRERARPGGFQGRVSAALSSLAFDPADTDFYVCGSAAMVADCRAVLEARGASQILVEAY